MSQKLALVTLFHSGRDVSAVRISRAMFDPGDAPKTLDPKPYTLPEKELCLAPTLSMPGHTWKVYIHLVHIYTCRNIYIYIYINIYVYICISVGIFQDVPPPPPSGEVGGTS